jgi:hypothetical protein
MEGAPGPIGAGGEMGAGARLANVFFSPSKVFESIARRPGWDWIVPVLLLAVAVFASSLVMTPKIDYDGFVNTMMKRFEANPNIPESQKAEIEQKMRENVETSKSGSGLYVTALKAVGFWLLPIPLVPLLYKGIAAAFGKPARYVALLAGYSYVQLVKVVSVVLGTVVVLPRNDIDMSEVMLFRLVKSHVAAFLDPEAINRALYVLLSYVDLFELAALALGVLAVSKITGLSTKAAAAVVGGLWGFWVLLAMGWGVFQATFVG